jgi:hypothetical protein
MRLHRILPCLVSASSYSLCATSCGIGIKVFNPKGRVNISGLDKIIREVKKLF